MSEKQSSSWDELPENNKTQVAASFLVSMETTGFNIADNLEEEDSIVSSNENLCKLLTFLVIINSFFTKILFSCEKKKKKDERERERRKERKRNRMVWCNYKLTIMYHSFLGEMNLKGNFFEVNFKVELK